MEQKDAINQALQTVQAQLGSIAPVQAVVNQQVEALQLRRELLLRDLKATEEESPEE